MTSCEAIAMRQIIYDFYVYDQSGSWVWMLVDNLVQSASGPEIDLQTYADEHKQVLAEHSPKTEIEDYTTMTVAGQEFLVMPTHPKKACSMVFDGQKGLGVQFCLHLPGENGRDKTIEF